MSIYVFFLLLSKLEKKNVMDHDFLKALNLEWTSRVALVSHETLILFLYGVSRSTEWWGLHENNKLCLFIAGISNHRLKENTQKDFFYYR